jgi:hypothetical protein
MAKKNKYDQYQDSQIEHCLGFGIGFEYWGLESHCKPLWQGGPRRVKFSTACGPGIGAGAKKISVRYRMW